MSQLQLSVASGLSCPYLSVLETGNMPKNPSVKSLVAIAGALSVSAGDLFDDWRLVPVVGKAYAGEHCMHAVANSRPLHHVVQPSELNNVVFCEGVEVAGGGMSPVYEEGDILFYSKTESAAPVEIPNRAYICEGTDGFVQIRCLRNGAGPGHFDLSNYAPNTKNMINVKLKWAAPVLLHMPKAFVRKAPE